jgi:chaperonin GroES
MTMANAPPDHEPGHFSIKDRLSDPVVNQGYEEQGAVLEAASLIRGMREASGLTQAALAVRLGTSQAHLSMLERGVGRHGPTFLMLHKIAQACRQELQISVRPTAQPEMHAPDPRPVAYAAPSRGTRFRPLHDRIVVRPLVRESHTVGGIIIPDTAQEKPIEGEVVAVGPGKRNENGEVVPNTVEAGERILFGKWSGTDVKINGEVFLIMKEADIMGVVEAPAGDGKKTKAA